VFAGVELGHGLEFRAHAIEERFPRIGHRWAGGPATKALPERRLVTDGLDEDELASVAPGQVPRAEPQHLLAERRVQDDTASGVQHHRGLPEDLVERPGRKRRRVGALWRPLGDADPGQHLPDPIRRDDGHADRVTEGLRQRTLAAAD
jgi:hypothetical protein